LYFFSSRRRHTRFSRDWSSDVCSSDLALLGKSGQAVLRVASALEAIHCYSLVHDDLPAMDDDDLRRGQPTVHRAFDEAAAILAEIGRASCRESVTLSMVVVAVEGRSQ